MQEIEQQPQYKNQPRPSRVRNQPPKASKKKIWLILAFILILVVVGILFILSRSQEKEPESTEADFETFTFEEEELPTPTPTPLSIKRDEITIKVLNGTGIAKQAAYLKDKLIDLGYENVDTANATEQENEETKVVFNSNVPDEIRQEIFDELEVLYKRVNTSTKALKDVDIEIVAGLRKGQELPTPTPTQKAEEETNEDNSPTPTPTITITPTPSPSPTPTQTP